MTAVLQQALKDAYSKAQVEALSSEFKDPAWLKAARLKGWEHFEAAASDPAASGARWLDELKKAASWSFDPGAEVALPAAFAPSLAEGEWGELSGSRSYGGSQDFDALLDDEARKAGVVFCSLRQALQSHPALLEKHLFSRTPPDETSFAALNAACFGQGSFLYIPKDVQLRKPLRNMGVHSAGKPGFFPRTLVVLEQGAQATLIDELRSATEHPGFCCAVSELILGANAQLNYINFQGLNLKSGASLRQTTVLSRDSYLYTLGVVTGGAWSSSSIGSRLEGEGASVDLLGLVLGGGDQRLEIRTLQDHVARSGQSDALIKTILRGRAHSWFDGVVKIYKAGQNSNAFQSNPNLLLSAEAKAESVPTLEIEADDVACKHAASIGSIDEEERFYLLSRGISEEDTESMIVEGFAAELAQRLPNEQLQERFVSILNRLAHEAEHE